MCYNLLMTIITSKSNNLIKKTKKLLKKKYREQSYLIEGWHLFEEAEKANAEFLNIFVLEDFADRVEHMSNVTFVTPEVLKELTDSKTPQGIIAEVAMPILPLANLKAGRYLVLEDVQDPGNVGTMIRTADAAGLDGVLISDKSADIYNQKHFALCKAVISICQFGEQMSMKLVRLCKILACRSLQRLFQKTLLIIKL